MTHGCEASERRLSVCLHRDRQENLEDCHLKGIFAGTGSSDSPIAPKAHDRPHQFRLFSPLFRSMSHAQIVLNYCLLLSNRLSVLQLLRLFTEVQCDLVKRQERLTGHPDSSFREEIYLHFMPY